MIHFNILQIVPDGRYLNIEAEIDSNDYFKDVYIDSIIIDNQDTYVDNGPSSKPIYTYKSEGNNKKVTLRVCSKDLNINFSKSILFVYVTAKGIPAPDTPCGWDNSIVMHTVINLLPIYRISLNYIKELGNTCITPKGFIDYILRFKALDLSVKTGNYIEAIKIWKEFFINNIEVPISKCNCYGRIN